MLRNEIEREIYNNNKIQELTKTRENWWEEEEEEAELKHIRIRTKWNWLAEWRVEDYCRYRILRGLPAAAAAAAAAEAAEASKPSPSSNAAVAPEAVRVARALEAAEFHPSRWAE